MSCPDAVLPPPSATVGTATITQADVQMLYDAWPAPTCIIADGPYGLSGYADDLDDPDMLANWYVPHVAAWSARCNSGTALWFWNTELGWANVHPVLQANGWQYRGANIWDKGIEHVAGNLNTPTIRKFPTVTEVCAHYVRPPTFTLVDGSEVSMQFWLRSEWKRSGLPFSVADRACGVKNAATRKYLASDHLWYCPPASMLAKLIDYANEHGDPAGRPYFAECGSDRSAWSELRAKFACPFGVSNVWHVPHVSPPERLRAADGGFLHPCQKPLTLIRMLVDVCTAPDDVVWEPFGGTCPGAPVCRESGRRYFGAEPNGDYYKAAVKRLRSHVAATASLFDAQIA